MAEMRAFMIDAQTFDVQTLLTEWQWLVPKTHNALFLTILGDWVFGTPDGSIWSLSVLDGDYRKIAINSDEYNKQKNSFQWLEENFCAGWQEIAFRHGLNPTDNECLGWKIHPIIGGKFEITNLQIFNIRVYQSLMSQLHRKLQYK